MQTICPAHFIVMFLKARFIWFPLNAAGMVAGGGMLLPATFIMVLVTWIVKYAIWKIGGASMHRKVLLACIGFIACFYMLQFIQCLVSWFTLGFTIPPP